jgi:hypothetical protein
LTLEDFIAAQIKTMDELHALLLCRAYPESSWGAVELGNRLGIPPAAAAHALAVLAGRGLLAPTGQPGRYQWQLPPPGLEPLIAELVKLDQERPVTLIRMIYHNAGSVQAFADAFKLKKEKGN